MRALLLAGLLCAAASAAHAQQYRYNSPPGTRGSYVAPYTSPPGYNASPYRSGAYSGGYRDPWRYGNGPQSSRGPSVEPYRSPPSLQPGGRGGGGNMNPFSGTFGTR